MSDEIVFFRPRDNVNLQELADHIGATLSHETAQKMEITSVGPVEAAADGCLTFIDNPKYLEALGKTKASAVICAERYVDQIPTGVVPVVAEEPYKAFSSAMAFMFPLALRPQPILEAGVSPQAHVHKTAVIEADVTIEAGAVVGKGAHIGSGSLIGPNAIVGAGCRIGRSSAICAGAMVANALIGNKVIIHSGVRIGSDGFGFAMGPGGHKKIPQVGRVVIQDSVEIGANTCIDRGSNRDTVIGEGTKIDNLVMIGHNVVIGRHCVIVAQCGIAGSAELQDYVVLGGQAAINGHIKIGMGAQIAGLSGVSGDVPPGVQWGGVPARPIKHWMRDIARIRRDANNMMKKKGKSSDE